MVINSIPKLRDGTVQDFDINSVDDCLLSGLVTIIVGYEKFSKFILQIFD